MALEKEFFAKHPEWRYAPPRDRNVKEFHDAELKQRKEAADIDEKIRSWKPLDTHAFLYHDGPFVALLYQYRVEFYRLPPGVECFDPLFRRGAACSEVPAGGVGAATAYDNALRIEFKKGGAAYQLKPYRVITFSYPVSSATFESHTRDVKAFAIGVRDSGYERSSIGEEAVMGRLSDEGQNPKGWRQDKADQAEFYGVLSTDGKILAKIPVPPGPDDETSDWGFVLPTPSWAIVWTAEGGTRMLSTREAKKEFSVLGQWHIVP